MKELFTRIWNYAKEKFGKEPMNQVTAVPKTTLKNSKIIHHPPRTIFGIQSAQLHFTTQQSAAVVQSKLVLERDSLMEETLE